MLPSARLFFNRDHVYNKNRRARQRAQWLYDDVLDEVKKAPELGLNPEPPHSSKAFPPLWGGAPAKNPELAEKWNLIAEVAEGYPRLLTWLAEGRASRYWNVFGAWAGLLRLIPGVRGWVVWNMLFRPVAQRAAWRPALYEAMLQDQRLKINQQANRSVYTMTVYGPGIPGLSAVTDVAVITPTKARTDVRKKIVNMTSGCIGISGLRGAGKTTLIRDICAHRYGTPRFRSPEDKIDLEDFLPGLRIMVQAPLRFESRDFLIHQYSCLCQAVLADVRFNPTSPADIALGPVLLPRSIRPVAVLGSLSGIALFLVAAGLAFHVVDGGWPFFSLHTRAWEIVGVVAAFCAGLIAFAWRTRRTLIEIRQISNLAVDASARLGKLHYQRTDTRSRGAAVGGPMGTGLNLGTSRQFVEQAMSLPELIDDYRDFVERVVAALQEKWREEQREWRSEPGEGPAKCPRADIRLIFGIDEIDQIDDPEQACKFLEDLSATFGIPHCVHLISLSPRTLATVDQRMVPLKTSSGGIFDEMVWLEPLGLDGARAFLDRRVTGFPACFIALTYVLSGGLPRELARVARTIFTTPGAQPRTFDHLAPALVELTVAANHVIEDEISALKRRTLACAATLDDRAAAALLNLLTDEAWPVSQLGLPAHDHQRSRQVRDVLGEVSGLWDGSSRQGFANAAGEVSPYTAEVCNSLLVGLYFLLTVRQLFTSAPDLVTALAYNRDDGDKGELNDQAPMLHDLARARIALGVSPYLAETLIRKARQAADEFPDLEFGPDIQLRFLTSGTAEAAALTAHPEGGIRLPS